MAVITAIVALLFFLCLQSTCKHGDMPRFSKQYLKSLFHNHLLIRNLSIVDNRIPHIRSSTVFVDKKM